MNIEQKITELLHTTLAESDLYLTNIKIEGKKKILITIDGDQLVTVGRCAEISRICSNYLEEQDLIENAYTLEVGSPGADAPLVMPRQYPKHIGRNLAIKCKDGEKKEGILKVADKEEIIIEEKKKVKGKKAELLSCRIPFEDIAEAKVIINFSKSAEDK